MAILGFYFVLKSYAIASEYFTFNSLLWVLSGMELIRNKHFYVKEAI